MKSVFVALWLVLTWLIGSVRAGECHWVSERLASAAGSDDWSSIREALEGGKLCVDARTLFGDRRALIHYAATKNTDEFVRLLVNHSADLDVQDLGDMAPLHVAAQLGKERVVECLLQNCVNVNAQNGQGQSALHLAVLNNHVSIVMLLIRGGINVDLKDRMGAHDGLPAIMRVAPDNHDMIKAYREAVYPDGVVEDAPPACRSPREHMDQEIFAALS